MRPRITTKQIEDLLIFLSIFISSYVFFKQPFEGYFHYLIFIFLLPFFIGRYGMPALVIKLLILPILISAFYVAMGDNTLFNFIKISVGLILSCSFYYYVFAHYKFNTITLFRLYIKGCLVVAIIGVIQAISYLIGFTPGYNFNWIFNKWGLAPGGIIGIRLNSIFSEPAQFAIMLSPATFISLHHLLTRRFVFMSKKWCVLILIVTLLTASSTGYFGLFFSTLIIALNFRKILDLVVITVVLYFIGLLLYSNIPEFKSRVDASLNIYNDKDLTIDDINSSSFVQYNNLHIASRNFINNPIFGTGLGSYPVAYEKYSLTKAENFLIKKGFEFNSQDGNSLFLRTMAETGLLGISFLLIIVFKCFVIKQNTGYDSISWLISGATLVLISLTYFRQGNYFLNGFPFFMWLYYYTYTNYKKYKMALL